MSARHLGRPVYVTMETWWTARHTHRPPAIVNCDVHNWVSLTQDGNRAPVGYYKFSLKATIVHKER